MVNIFRNQDSYNMRLFSLILLFLVLAATIPPDPHPDNPASIPPIIEISEDTLCSSAVIEDCKKEASVVIDVDDDAGGGKWVYFAYGAAEVEISL